MAKNLTIIKGDEYRAKIEQEFVKGDFFEEVYVEADSIMKEILQEMEDYCEKEYKKGYFRVKYQGMGNNIILFCAGRGQGKTSAMQSFADFLRKNVKGDALSPMEGYNFHVLESIDPTALDGKESILRVLISRLFSEYDKILSCTEIQGIEEKEFRTKNAALLELFQQCFVNIDYLKGRQEKDAGQDDLEYLAEMGNSAVLKDNLYKLIKTFFEIKNARMNHKEYFDKKNFLVVQIDDADLSIVDIFELCEDIRNYLSIPNVIVLMAADYDNLRDAVYKRYLEENKIFWHEMGEPERKAEYNTMASKYMEKVFPYGHRINLPKIDDALSQGTEAIHISYQKVLKDGEKEELLSKDVMACSDLQEQLFLEIYKKTGIVFLKPEDGMHPFLPHTLRQLTHLLKLLLDMKEVEFDLVYGERERQEEHAADTSHREIQKLKHNICNLKDYFIDYWCCSQLSDKERKVICKLEEFGQKKNSKRLYRFVQKYIGKDIVSQERDTYQKVIYEIRNCGDKLSESLKDALEIYFTFYFNEWFAKALQEQKEYRKIKRYLGGVLDAEEELKRILYSKERKQVLWFTVDEKKINIHKMDFMEGQSLEWLQRFCLFLDDQGNELEDAVFDDELASLQYNVFHAVLSVLDRKIQIESEAEDALEGSTVEDKELQVEPVQSLKADDTEILKSIKNVLANTDVQRYLSRKMRKYLKGYPRAKEPFNWSQECKCIYGIFDQWLDKAKYLNEKSVIHKDGLRNIESSTMWETLYYYTDDQENIVKNYKEAALEKLKAQKKSLTAAKDSLNVTGNLDELSRCLVVKEDEDWQRVLRTFQYEDVEPESCKRIKRYLEKAEQKYEDLRQMVQNIYEFNEPNERKISRTIGDCIGAINQWIANIKKIG